MEKTMTDLQKTMLTLPQDVQQTFKRLDTGTRNAYAFALRGRGWTLQSISDAADITRERVRQIVEDAPEADIAGLPLPLPPEKVVTLKPERVYVEPDPAKLSRLLELQPAAQRSRGPASSSYASAVEYTALLAEVHLEDGVSLYRLAKRLGVTHGALRFRLARWRYKEPNSGGASRVYEPLKR